MLSPLRNRFGIPGVISVVALVFAMFGGAYAASDNGGGKATASAKAKKGPRGPKGATGPAGAQGPAGPAGPAGAKGDAGAAGANGSNGATGPTGPTGATGATGVVGSKGATGFSGFTETLPPGKTETGVIGIATPSRTKERRPISFPISFPIPLAEESTIEIVLVGSLEKEKPGCPGRGGGAFPPASGQEYTPGVPQADPGFLCIYEAGRENVNSIAIPRRFVLEENEWRAIKGVNPSGGPMEVLCEAEGETEADCQYRATWAVTAPEA